MVYNIPWPYSMRQGPRELGLGSNGQKRVQNGYIPRRSQSCKACKKIRLNMYGYIHSDKARMYHMDPLVLHMNQTMGLILQSLDLLIPPHPMLVPQTKLLYLDSSLRQGLHCPSALAITSKLCLWPQHT